MPEKKIIYNGTTYILGTTGRYYYGTIKQKNVALHRRIWEDNNNEKIPEGYHIHHKDGNVFNNSIENLECISRKKHSDLHWQKDKESRMPALLKLAEIGRRYAKEWHHSHVGMQWHNEHYENIKDKMHLLYDRECSFCGKQIKTKRKNANCFCSGYCKLQFRDKLGIDNETRLCAKCNRPFEVNKYRKVMYCSSKCKPAPNSNGYSKFKTLKGR